MWFTNLFFSGAGTANAVMVIAVVAVLGLAFGNIKFGPIQLGIAGPLFVGLALGHFGFKMNMDILGFARVVSFGPLKQRHKPADPNDSGLEAPPTLHFLCRIKAAASPAPIQEKGASDGLA